MTKLTALGEPTDHAARRYIQRFEGNLSLSMAMTRLRRIIRNARFRHTLPGHARLYSSGSVNLVVVGGHIVTVYRLQRGQA